MVMLIGICARKALLYPRGVVKVISALDKFETMVRSFVKSCHISDYFGFTFEKVMLISLSFYQTLPSRSTDTDFATHEFITSPQ